MHFQYPTYAWPSLVLYTRSPTPAMILIAVRHVAPATCTPRDKQTRFSTRVKDKGKTIESSRIWIQTMACLWLITYSAKVPTWFLTIESADSFRRIWAHSIQHTAIQQHSLHGRRILRSGGPNHVNYRVHCAFSIAITLETEALTN
jgi:hypothetical protein